jgi:cathepsin A (carboxypeptidase C)
MHYHLTRNINAYLDNPSIRQKLGVDPHFANQNYSSCNHPIHFVFFGNLDHVRPTTHYVSALLERGIRVLIAAGNYDWLCNWIGVDAWTRALEWSGQDAFDAQKLRDWEVDGKKAGVARSFGGFTFATIDGAGHMVGSFFLILLFSD